jgi:hypothetical protein
MTTMLATTDSDDLMQDILAFGHKLVTTRDLDPVYCAIFDARLPGDQLARLLLAYWCFYHLGSAAWISEHEGADYWRWMLVAAKNVGPEPPAATGMQRWPRSAERRHFRGQKCFDAVTAISYMSPRDRLEGLAAMHSEREVMAEVQKWPMFGPWIAFKVADMLERCWGAHIHFDPDLVLMYDEPRKALDLLDPQEPKRAYQRLSSLMADRRAPPDLARRCGPQEVETVLCKWKYAMASWGGARRRTACASSHPRRLSPSDRSAVPEHDV